MWLFYLSWRKCAVLHSIRFSKALWRNGTSGFTALNNLAWSICTVQVIDGSWWLWFSSILLLRVAACRAWCHLSPQPSLLYQVWWLAVTGRVLGVRWDVLMGNSFLLVPSGPLRHPLLMQLCLWRWGVTGGGCWCCWHPRWHRLPDYPPKKLILDQLA